MAGVKAYNDGIGFHNGGWTVIDLPSEVYDDASFHSTSTNKSRFTVPSGHNGRYCVVGQVQWDDNTGGARGIGIYKNGTLTEPPVLEEAIETSNIGNAQNIAVILDLAVNDYVEVAINHSLAGTLGTTLVVLVMEKF